MKAVNLYILTRNTNIQLYTEYENVLAGRSERNKVKKDEFQSLNALVEELLNNGICIRELDGFYYSFSINQIGKEFDLLKIAYGDMVLNIELKSRLIPEEKIEEQLLRNKYYLNHLASEIRLFTYVQETNSFYTLENDKLKKSTINEVAGIIKKLKNFESGEIDRLFRAKDFLISPLNTPEKFINNQYFLTQQQEEIKREIISSISGNSKNRLWGITGSAGTGKTLLLYDLGKTLAMLIKDNFEEVLVYDEKELVDIDNEKLLGLLLEGNYKQEYQEILETLGIGR